MESSQTEVDDCIAFGKAEYKNNPAQLAKIKEFQETYSFERALWWYSRQSFIYRILMTAVHQQSIRLLFLLRFWIRDIYRQLKDAQCHVPMRVYWGGWKSNDDFDLLQASVGKLISINTFLSTSANRTVALSFLKHSPDHSKKLLYEITVNPQTIPNRPFADISSHSFYPSEKEVLFMIGSTFRIDNIYCADNGIWTIRMSLAAANEYNWEMFLQQIKKVSKEDGRLDIVTYGRILCQIGRYDKAETYYQRLLNEFPLDNHLSSIVHSELQKISS
ncbi:unnamed protein product [Rotaria sp. Silwood2]|nr:unnamed protein product [Rotaria sp. Silwood2]